MDKVRPNTDRCHRGSRYSNASEVTTRPVFRDIRVAHCFLTALVWVASPLIAQRDAPQQKESQAGLQEPARASKASRVERPPKLDGKLDDPEWQNAKPVTNFLQREPFEGQTPSEKTEVRILYDRHSVYFGILCFDSDPKGIIATELRRDVSQELDDYFEIIIDSAHDRRNAYVFQFNPLGTQRDALSSW
jgi:hypothetical protein